MPTRQKHFGAQICLFAAQLLLLAWSSNLPSAVTGPLLVFDISQSHVSIRGEVSSAAHRTMLLNQAAEFFPEKSREFDLIEKPALPAGWALISEVTLRAVAATYSSVTEITATSLSITGISGNQTEWLQRISAIEKNLLPGMLFRPEVAAVGNLAPRGQLCERVITNAMQNVKFEFSRSSIELRTSAYAGLDKLTQLLTDCPAVSIEIVGHTDSIGDRASNVAVSLARAASVSSYLIARGIRDNRVSIRGAGYSEPLDESNSYRAHQINRRIEIQVTSASN